MHIGHCHQAHALSEHVSRCMEMGHLMLRRQRRLQDSTPGVTVGCNKPSAGILLLGPSTCLSDRLQAGVGLNLSIHETIVSLHSRTFDALMQWEISDIEHQQYGSGEGTPRKCKTIYACRLPTMPTPLRIIIIVLGLLRPPQHPLLHTSENISQSIRGCASQALAYAALITIWRWNGAELAHCFKASR